MKERIAKQRWVTQIIFDNTKKRQQTRNWESVEYHNLSSAIRSNAKKAKEECLQRRFEKMGKCQQKDPNTMCKRVKELAGSKSRSSLGCIKAGDGTTILKKDKIVERLSEYTEELF